jgi:putative pyruvate formate lyase activating enzyme
MVTTSRAADSLASRAAAFVRRREDFVPAYLRLYNSGELACRVERALTRLRDCTLCPRACHANRPEAGSGTCHTGRYAVVSSAFPHHGEEDCLRGRRGSGTIFFGWCNLRCVFCQNYELSWGGEGREIAPDEFADLMLELQACGCHNINFVTPSHVVPQILEALLLAVPRGLRLPLVYNTSAYDSLESLALLDGLVDIFMPDFKFWDPRCAQRYSRAPDYPEVARAAIREMHRQVGPLTFDEEGIALRGVLLRHLVMPANAAGTREILEWVARELGPDTYVNLMDQYRPAGRVGSREFVEIARCPSSRELESARAAAAAVGLYRLDHRRRWF